MHVIDPFPVPADWQAALSIDPGLNNPLSCHWYAVDYDGNVYAVAEHFEAGKDIAYHAEKIREISAALGWKTDGRGRIAALIDSAANQRTLASVKSVTELFYENGILANPNVKKDLFAGIQRVKRYLNPSGGPRLYIFRSCVNLIREFKSYWWGDGDAPKKADDHALDELRYFLMTRPFNDKPEEKSEIVRHKERLSRAAAKERRRGM